MSAHPSRRDFLALSATSAPALGLEVEVDAEAGTIRMISPAVA